MKNNSHGVSLQKLIVYLFVAYLFLAFPFTLRSLNVQLYAYVLYLFTVFIILALSVSFKSGKIRNSIAPLKSNSLLLIFVLLYISFVVVLSLVSIINVNNDNMRFLTVKFQVLIYALFVFLLLDRSDYNRLMRYYLNLMVILSLSGILLTLLIYLNKISPSTLLTLDSGGIRNAYLFGFTWPNSWIGDLHGLTRLQSFTDEAGTFAYCLLIAIVISYYKEKYFFFSIYSLALLLTFSVGALSAFFLWLIFFVMLSKMNVLKFVTAISIISIIILAIGNNEIYDYISLYFDAKVDYTNVNVERSSLGDRVNAVGVVLQSIENYPFGLGAAGVSEVGISVAVGWIIPLLQTGIVGWILYLLAFLFLLIKAIKASNDLDSDKKAAAQILLILAYAAFQRSEMDGTFWHWFWISNFIKQFQHTLPLSFVKRQKVNHSY